MSVVLLGGGGHASDVLAVIEALSAAGEPQGPVYVADDTWAQPERFEDRAVEVKRVESVDAGIRLGRHIVAVGYPMGRRNLSERAALAGGRPATPLLHPDASIGVNVEAQDGVVVMGQTWVSSRVALGAHTHVGYGVTIGHDSVVGSWCAVMPGACIGGDVTIGDGVLVGANATVLQGLTVGDDAMIGAGATVISDVPPE